MESTSKQSALTQLSGVVNAIKSWFGLFNLFLEANQIVIADNLHASTFSEIATWRGLLWRQLLIIASSRSNILTSSREVNNLPFESAGLAVARRVDPLEVIPSPKSATKQERRRAYRRKRSARLQSPQFKCGPPCGRTTIYHFTLSFFHWLYICKFRQ